MGTRLEEAVREGIIVFEKVESSVNASKRYGSAEGTAFQSLIVEGTEPKRDGAAMASLKDAQRAVQEGQGDHVFLRVTPMTGVGRALKSKKFTPKFIGPYQISERVGTVAYRVGLPPHLSNLHDVFHVSQLRKYVPDPSHVIQSDDVQVRDNLTVETLPVRIDDRKVKTLRGKEIPLVRVVWSGATGESLTWELESKMLESYPE
ncbi:uncharacterized protein, partial [Medicago truncatula]|uniref:uncharacterized protein n=1 Tax=Medicago truncatula TaxID=3880 RepID=UPI00196731C9